MGEQGKQEVGRPESLGMEQYVFVLRKQWRTAVLVLVLCVIASGAYLLFTPRLATATATLNLNVITTEPFNPQRPASGLLDGPTEADIARSHVVADRASELLGGAMTATQIREASEVTTAASATVMKVSFSAATEREAVAGADAVAKAYLNYRSEQAESRVTAIVSMLTEQIDELDEALLEANATIAEADTTTDEVQATTQQQQILTELEGLLSQRNLLRSVDTTSGTVLSSATDNTVYFLPARTRALLTGFAAGVVLGIAAAFIRNVFDRRVRSARELSRLLGAPVIGVPGQKRSQRGTADEQTLRVARERILGALADGDALLLLDTTNEGLPSNTSKTLQQLLRDAGSDIEVLDPHTDDAAEILRALRRAKGAVMIFNTTAIRTENAEWLRREAETSDTPILGIIEAARVTSSPA